MTQTERCADNLRALATWFDKHPDAPVPFGLSDSVKFICHLSYGKEARDKEIRSIGTFEKNFDNNYMNLRVTVGDYTLEYYTPRASVCTPKITGTRHVEEKVIPATVIPAHEENIIEWDCPDSILSK
jgi:hypothetical protein